MRQHVTHKYIIVNIIIYRYLVIIVKLLEIAFCIQAILIFIIVIFLEIVFYKRAVSIVIKSYKKIIITACHFQSKIPLNSNNLSQIFL